MSRRYKSFRECMYEATAPVVQRRIVQPAQRLSRVATRQNFGDAQLKPARVMPRVLVRLILMLPVAAVGTVLCFSVIGLPLGIPLLLWAGAFISKPIRQHPNFNTNPDTLRTEDYDDDAS